MTRIGPRVVAAITVVAVVPLALAVVERAKGGAAQGISGNETITTVAGGGIGLGDGGPATSAAVWADAIAIDGQGDLYINDALHNRIRKVSDGVITTVAGIGKRGYSGDGGPARSAELKGPRDIAVDAQGTLYIADTLNNRIRAVRNGIITTVAGTGTLGFSGDGGPAIAARLAAPTGIALDPAGDLFIADFSNARVREISHGTITTVAGNGTGGYAGDGGPATSAQLHAVRVAVDSHGNLYVSDDNDRVRKVSGGIITTAAGISTRGFAGDGGPATSAELSRPTGLAVDSEDNLYIDDWGNERVRKVSSGVITTVAGDGADGTAGDGGPARSAQLALPNGLAFDAQGNLYIGDRQRVRRVGAIPKPPPAGGATGALQSGRKPPLVKMPGSSTFVQLRGSQPLPPGTVVDVGGNRGIVLQNAKREDMAFYGQAGGGSGQFQLAGTASGYLQIRLVAGNRSACKGRRLAAKGPAQKRRPVRSLWGHGKGHYRTIGRYAIVSVRGTYWLTQDRCDGTRAFVKEGVVTVRDVPHHRTITLRAGQSYLARTGSR